jgi:hypothetical protein
MDGHYKTAARHGGLMATKAVGLEDGADLLIVADFIRLWRLLLGGEAFGRKPQREPCDSQHAKNLEALEHGLHHPHGSSDR